MKTFGEREFYITRQENKRMKELKQESQKNSRKKELQLKSNEGTATPEEKAELQGIYAFPDNPRAAKLLAKKQLHVLTPGEEQELSESFQRKHDSQEVQELRKRVKERDPNIEIVNMNDGKFIEVSATDDDEKIIWTMGLGGCFGTLVFCEDLKGNCRAILTHYGPTMISENISKLRQLIEANVAMKTSAAKQTVFILAANNIEKNDNKINALQVAIQAGLGKDVEIKTELYPLQQLAGVKDWGVFIVRITPRKKSTYRTWFSQGQLGKLNEEKNNQK